MAISAGATGRSPPIGRWYNEYEPRPGGWYGYMLWDIHPDQTIVAHGRVCWRGRKSFTDIENSGTWDYTGDTMSFAWTGHGSVITGCRIYKVVDRSPDRWTFESTCTRNVYAMVRVTADSKLPSCEMIS